VRDMTHKYIYVCDMTHSYIYIYMYICTGSWHACGVSHLCIYICIYVQVRGMCLT